MVNSQISRFSGQVLHPATAKSCPMPMVCRERQREPCSSASRSRRPVPISSLLSKLARAISTDDRCGSFATPPQTPMAGQYLEADERRSLRRFVGYTRISCLVFRRS